MKTLPILNDPPYGSERSYNGLRLAGSLPRREEAEVRVFLTGDAATRWPGSPRTVLHHLDRMLGSALRHGAQVGLLRHCLDARGIDEGEVEARTAPRSRS